MALSPDQHRLARVTHLIRGRLGTVHGLEILDLASRTGAFSEGLARLGADVTGIEGRRSNVDQIHDPLARYIVGDVRNLAELVTRRFDVTLCLGILYHLQAEEAVELLKQVRLLTESLLILDTHVSLHPTDTVILGLDNDLVLQGHWYDEGGAVAPWSAIGNFSSFWFDKGSLATLLGHTGWSAGEVLGKAYPGEPEDRCWYVAT